MNLKPLIYAVDDEEPIRELLYCALDSAGFTPLCFSGAEELFENLKKSLPRLIILDIMLDGLDGFAILNKLKKSSLTQSIPVIMLSAKGDEVSKVKGLNLGADDYVAKPFGVMELIARVNAGLRRAAPKSESLSYKDIVIEDNKHKIFSNNVELVLTLKEYNLLAYFIKNAGVALKRDDILNAVWGEGFFGETRTLDIHVNKLRKALKSTYSEVLIETVRGIGYNLK